MDTVSGCEINFDHARDHEEQLLVYEQMGGGLASFHLLNRLTLTGAVARAIAARLDGLGSGYEAIHIRHSDYKTDFDTFLRRLRPVLRGRRVVMCSDSAEAKGAAAALLDPTTTVMSVADIPDTKGAPLHTTEDVDYQAANIHLLADLFAMSLARRLFFTRLSGHHTARGKASGFSMLAAVLSRHPAVLRNLLSAADPAAIARLFDRGGVSFTPRRWFHLLDYFRWNYRPLKNAYNANRRTRRPIDNPESIPTRYAGIEDDN